MRRLIGISFIFVGGCAFSATSPSLDRISENRNTRLMQEQQMQEHCQRLETKINQMQGQIDSLCQEVWKK